MAAPKELNIYDMNLHDVTSCNNGLTTILRVPGGWIYTQFTEHDDYKLSSVFVPFISRKRITKA